MLIVCRKKVGVVSSPKTLGSKTFTFLRFFDDFETQWRLSSKRNVTYKIRQKRLEVREPLQKLKLYVRPMALNTFKCTYLIPLHFKGLMVIFPLPCFHLFEIYASSQDKRKLFTSSLTVDTKYCFHSFPSNFNVHLCNASRFISFSINQ